MSLSRALINHESHNSVFVGSSWITPTDFRDSLELQVLLNLLSFDKTSPQKLAIGNQTMNALPVFS